MRDPNVIFIETLEENLFEPNRNWPTDIFEERSHARWAAFELWEQILDHPNTPPDDIIEEFIWKMEIMACSTKIESKARIFKIAAETAKDILTLF